MHPTLRSGIAAAVVGLSLAAMAGAPAHADWQECYTVCSLAKAGQCVEHRTSCTNHPTGDGPSNPTRYGAIAYSPSSGHYGFSDRFGSRAQAEGRALSQCGNGDCVVATWFVNNCGALAASSNGRWGAEHGYSVERAQALAQARCTSEGGSDCTVRVSHCSGG